MSLAERLKRLGVLRGLPAESPEPSDASEQSSCQDAGPGNEPAAPGGADLALSEPEAGEGLPSLRYVPDEPPPPAPRSLVSELLPGTVPCSNMHGSFLMREVSYSLEHVHGRFALGEMLACEPRVLELLARDRQLGSLDLTRAVFLDTETTGLSGGTGTVAFLVGLAAFEDGGLKVRQLFMRDFDEEAAMLHQLGLLLEGSSCLITYNGKSFDIPLLAGRYVANRARPPVELSLPHLDLLHPARRIWRDEFPEMSLGYLEKAMLGVQRGEDVPGALIPAMYVRYLTTRRASLMAPVLRHNELDVLSLASVLAAGARACRGDSERPGERFGVARTLDLMKSTEAAVAEYRRALALACSPAQQASGSRAGDPAFDNPVRPECSPALERKIRKSLAKLLARMGEHDAAESEWHALADRWEDLDALEALAKKAEHRHRDLPGAIALVQRALARLTSPLMRGAPGQDRSRRAMHTRLARLQAKSAPRA
jgi:hypothetical protein